MKSLTICGTWIPGSAAAYRIEYDEVEKIREAGIEFEVLSQPEGHLRLDGRTPEEEKVSG